MSRLNFIQDEGSERDDNFQEHVMTTRRAFLSAAVMGTAAAFTPLFAQGQSVAGAATAGAAISGGRPLPTNTPSTSGHYRPPYRVGLGGVPIGNGFKPTTDAQAQGALEAAWAAGVRYFDTSPWYGLGLSERRFGHFLHNQKRDDYVLSTKVGRSLKASETLPGTMWKDPSPFSYEYDYTAAGVRRSVEDSLQRLGLSRIDIVFIHDLSPAEWQHSRFSPDIPTSRRTLAEVERGHILQVVQETNWVIGGPQGAAARLGLRRTTLLYRMEKRGIPRRPA
jgi:hypothetical protein